MSVKLGKLVKTLKEKGLFVNFCGNPEEVILDAYNNSLEVPEENTRNIAFIAIKGHKTDGHQYIQEVIKKGVKTVVVDQDRYNELLKFRDSISIVAVKDTRLALPIIASEIYEYPQRKVKIVGITGTKGKTTTAYLTYNILKSLGYKPALIGTVEYRYLDEIVYKEVPNTTPDPLFIIKFLKKAVEKGCTHTVMEITSIALDQHRVDMMELDVAMFTNFSREHLDYHKTMENYFNAKLKIFDLLKPDGTAIINTDNEYYALEKEYLKKLGKKYFEVSTKTKADFYATDIKMSLESLEYTLHSKPYNHKVIVNIPGIFNVYNSMFAIAGIYALFGDTIDYTKVVDSIKGVRVPGRFEVLKTPKGAFVIIDYAHTHEALKELLESVREAHPNGRIITVFGAGGDRDKGKRPLMGEVAGKLSNMVIITNDNPRSENPIDIAMDIVKGVLKYTENFLIILDRRKAIELGINLAFTDDVVVIAGKGHEDYQIIGNTKIHFSDREVVLEIIKDMEKGK